LASSAGLLYWHVFRDEVLETLLRRQAYMQHAYEDRLASMRVQIDRVVSRQLLDQGAIEGRVHDLLSRQAQLESRAAMIAALADQVGMTGDSGKTLASQPLPLRPATDAAAIAPRTALPLPDEGLALRKQALPSGASAHPEPEAASLAPVRPANQPAMRPEPIEKPRPEGIELRSDLTNPARLPPTAIADPEIPAAIRLGALSHGLERIEQGQIRAVATIGASARGKARDLKSVIMDAGLEPERLAPPSGKSVGGPFMPLMADPRGSAFERELSRIATDYQAANRLTHIITALPLRRPLGGRQDITSGYGVRMDPFLGRMALHSGLDMREDAGAPVRATAGGKVVSAGWSGGYGNMVEIDHGNELSTRYGHLASISVSEGQTIGPGAILGRVGSTGRSTGPHLHYEVRIDGEAVDPIRFLRASDKLAGLK
jgi:murein DD-endopeptidase MepM/ murein hydrolase activator NlpD